MQNGFDICFPYRESECQQPVFNRTRPPQDYGKPPYEPVIVEYHDRENCKEETDSPYLGEPGMIAGQFSKFDAPIDPFRDL
jgi:hypothetical protein